MWKGDVMGVNKMERCVKGIGWCVKGMGWCVQVKGCRMR